MNELDKAKKHKPWRQMDKDEMKDEFRKCSESPAYFMRNYLYVVHPIRGLVLFDLYDFQVKILNAIRQERFNIIRKFRQAGITTLACGYALWLIIFKKHKTVTVLSIGDTESKEVLERVVVSFNELPPFLRPEIVTNNAHLFELKNGSKIRSRPSATTSARGIAGSFLIVDEAAFIENIGELWKSAYPILSTGGAALLISTVNGMGGKGSFFYDVYKSAKEQSNAFNAVDIHWREHPEYNRTPGYEHLYDAMLRQDPPIDIDKWEEITRKNVGLRGWLQEYECQFLGTGDTYIDGETLTHVSKNVNNDYSISLNGRMRTWEPPLNVYNYLISIDPALGTGRNYSAFHVINLYNGLQVAEFYSNVTPLDELADIVARTGYEYNNAYVTYERNAIGYNLKYHLFERLQYPNLIVDPDSQGDEFGILTTPKLREQMLAKLEEFIRVGKIKIRSQRTIEELFTFIVNDAGKVQADEGKTDDLVMSLALGIHALSYLFESTPMDMPLSLNLLEQPKYSDAEVLKQKHSFDIQIADTTGKRIKEDYQWILYGGH